jgi:hypothetical protein
MAAAVGVGIGGGDVLGEGAPGGKAGLELGAADLMIAAQALRATPAAADHREDHPIARFEAARLGANFLDDAAQLVAGDVRQAADVRVVPHPAVPVAAANAVGQNAQDDAVGRRLGVGHRLDGEGFAERVI